MKRFISVLIFTFFLFIVGAIITKAQSCSNETDCKKLISEYEQKLVGIRDQKNTLSSQIEFADTQIYLTTLRIQDTERKITQTADEVESLKGRIVTLNSSLDYLSKLLLVKIVESYKRREPPLLSVFIDPDNASTMINRLKYAKVAEENDRKLAFQVQQAKLNFEQQKDLREDKQKELAQLSTALEGQKNALNSQKTQKQQLLAATQSDETVYQRLLAQARANLSGFGSFVQAAGGATLTSFGSGSNGWYYTQRDPSWGNTLLPGSSSSLALAGCAVTSVAMVCNSYGQGTNPLSIAGNSGNFIGGDLLNSAFSCSGRSTSWIGTSKDAVRSYVNSNNPVILRLVAPSVSGLHFVVAWKTDGDDFIIHDPYYGPDKKFSERYSWDQVTTAIAIH